LGGGDDCSVAKETGHVSCFKNAGGFEGYSEVT
jgi:hypothetical protein